MDSALSRRAKQNEKVLEIISSRTIQGTLIANMAKNVNYYNKDKIRL